MRQFIYTLFLFFSVGTLSWAQPMLNSNTLPPIGFQTEFHFGAIPASPGPAGANITWDFSNLTYDPAIQITKVVNPSLTSHFGTYSMANFCIQSNADGNTLYSYYSAQNNGIYKLGEGVSDDVPFEVDYLANSKLWVKFPFVYNEQITDTWAGASESGTETIVYDGYGTIITPFATFNNVVRIKEIREDYTSYTWFSTNPVFQIFEIATQFSVIAKNIPEQVLKTDKLLMADPFAMYPNPASDFVILDTKGIEGRLVMYDASGRQVKQIDIRDGLQHLEVSDLSPGMYFYTVQSSGQNQYKGKLAVR